MRPFPQLHYTVKRIIHLLDHCTLPTHIYQIHTQLILHDLLPNTTIAHHFISACQFLGLLDSALLLYSQLPEPHIFICNNLIRAFSHSQFPHKSISIYISLQKTSIRPSNYTFPFVLKSLSDLKDLDRGQYVHNHVVKLGYQNDIYVQNSLLNLYASCCNMVLCRRVFDEMPQRDVVSWTVMITGYREAEKFDDALIAFEQMQHAGIMPNRVTMVNALAVCARVGAVDTGVWIHDFVRRSGWELDVILGTSLINMYGKCGRIEQGLGVFCSLKKKNVYTWNALIMGLAMAKSGTDAIHWFSKMEQQGIKPDDVTLVGVLCACSHAGLLDLARKIFSFLLEGKYGFSPGVKHYACMVDLLARSGCLEDAFRVIKDMPFEPTTSMWGALLAGCRAHGDLKGSEFVAWKLVELAPENSAYYVFLSNLYAEMGRWGDVEKVRTLMKERGLKKDIGSSSLEFEPREPVKPLLACVRNPSVVCNTYRGDMWMHRIDS